MNKYVLLLAAVMIINTGFALAILLRAPTLRVNRIYALLAGAVMLWGATGYYEQTAAAGDPLLDKMAAIPFAAAVLMIFLMCQFALYFPATNVSPAKTIKRFRFFIGYTAIPLLIIAAVARHSVIAQITTDPVLGNNVTPGPLYPLFALYYLGGLSAALTVLWRKYRRTHDRHERAQIMLVFAGFLSLIGVAFLTNIILPVLAHNPSLVRTSFLSTLFLTGFFGYAIVNHRMFDVRLIFARTIAYILLLGALSVIYAIAVVGLVRLLFPGSGLGFGENAALIVFSIIVSFTLPPLRAFFRRVTDRFFYKDQYDVQALLDRVSGIFASQLELQPLMDKFLLEVIRTMRLVNAQLLVVGGNTVYGQSEKGKRFSGTLTLNGIKQFHAPFIVADEVVDPEQSKTLRQIGVQVVMQLRAHGELTGYLVLGDKLSGTSYTDNDLAVLEIMRKELAVAIANAKAYDEIASFNVTLQARIRQATKRLQVANKNLRALDKTKDEFISMASHQLGTPLTAITGYLSMALDNDNKNMTPDQREFVSYALEAAEKMVYMSGDMLNVSRLNSGRFMIQRQVVDLAKILHQEIHQLEPSAARKNLKLTAEIPDHPVMAKVDESKTRQVMMNFIDNALYYTESGGVHVKLSATDRNVTLTVTDTGIGVPPEEQAKLFAKFYRAGNAKAVRPDGTGLGLYLAKRVIEDQGGTIIFASKVGEGSTFGFKLPLEP